MRAIPDITLDSLQTLCESGCTRRLETTYRFAGLHTVQRIEIEIGPKGVVFLVSSDRTKRSTSPEC